MKILQKMLHSVFPEGIYISIRTAWRHLVRLYKEGFYNAYYRSRVWPRILETPPIYTDPLAEGGPLCVHLMCHRGDYVAAIWALKSFYHQAKVSYPLALHVQGTSTPELEDRLRTHFPQARIVLQAEADRVVESELRRRKLARLGSMRKLLPIMQKFTDVITIATAQRIVILDSDVLFFSPPDELTRVDTTRRCQALFQRDYIDAYVLSRERALTDLGVDLLPQINTGIVSLSPVLLDLERCEEYLSHPDFERPNGHMEQTLYALEASRHQMGAHLPASYFVGRREPVDCSTLIARHYAGPSRCLLAREGMAYLIKTGFIQALRSEFLSRQPGNPASDMRADRATLAR